MTSNVSWDRVPVSSVALGIFDGPHATPKPAAEGPVFLGIQNITEDGRIDLSNIRHISEEDYHRWTRRACPEPGDIVFTYEATLNRYAIIPEGFVGCLGRRVALIRPNPKLVHPRYLLAYFMGDEWREVIARNVLLGSTVDRIPLTSFPEFEIALPPMSVQRTIASILSAYDDLIENNLRRIAILEEIAQAIYREWFVEFRYPGHEDVSMVDSELGPIPDGWNVTSFSDVADVLSGGTPRTSVPEYWGGDIPFFTPKDSGGSFWAIATERTITRLGLDNCNSQLYPKETIFITARGTVGKVALSSADMAVNQSCYALRSKDGVSQYFVFLALRAEAATLRKQAHGAVFDTITMDTFDRLRLAVPPEHLLDSWDRTVGDMMQLSLNLSLTNLRLAEIRDLLLPRLISGELDVSDIAMSTEVDNL